MASNMTPNDILGRRCMLHPFWGSICSRLMCRAVVLLQYVGRAGLCMVESTLYLLHSPAVAVGHGCCMQSNRAWIAVLADINSIRLLHGQHSMAFHPTIRLVMACCSLRVCAVLCEACVFLGPCQHRLQVHWHHRKERPVFASTLTNGECHDRNRRVAACQHNLGITVVSAGHHVDSTELMKPNLTPVLCCKSGCGGLWGDAGG